MSQKIIYVTSFAQDMYEATGHRLVSSFLKTGTRGSLLCFTENFALPPGDLPLGEPSRVISRSIENESLLTNWLKANRDVIPEHLGGEHTGCICPGGPLSPHDKRHKQPCVGYWFNRNASRWYRKIVSLVLSLEHDADILVWLDSDCYFKKELPPRQLEGIFSGRAVFYMQSRQRKVMEGGIIGFHLKRGGRDFIEKTMDRYQSGEFRKHPRWDDCYQFQLTRDQNRNIPTKDIATKASGHADVAKHSLVAPYLEHAKGTHSRGIGLMI